MRTAIPPSPDPFATAASAVAGELAGVPGMESIRERLERLPLYVRRCGDVLADVLEDLVGALSTDRPRLATRVSAHLIDVLLAEEGFSRRFWKALRAHLRLLQSDGRHHEAEACLRETLHLAAALG